MVVGMTTFTVPVARPGPGRKVCIREPTIYLSIDLSTYLSIYLLCTYLYILIYLFTCLFIYLFIFMDTLQAVLTMLPKP